MASNFAGSTKYSSARGKYLNMVSWASASSPGERNPSMRVKPWSWPWARFHVGDAHGVNLRCSPMDERPGLVGRIVAFFHDEVPLSVVDGSAVQAASSTRLRRPGRGRPPVGARQPRPPRPLPRHVQIARLCAANRWKPVDRRRPPPHRPRARAAHRRVRRFDRHRVGPGLLRPGAQLDRTGPPGLDPGGDLDVEAPVALPEVDTGVNPLVAAALVAALERAVVAVDTRLREDAPHLTTDDSRPQGGGPPHPPARGRAQGSPRLRPGARPDPDDDDAAVPAERATQARLGLERPLVAGQLAVMPAPSRSCRPPCAAGAGRDRPGSCPGPGEPGFDPWCLCDPRTVKAMRETARPAGR